MGWAIAAHIHQAALLGRVAILWQAEKRAKKTSNCRLNPMEGQKPKNLCIYHGTQSSGPFCTFIFFWVAEMQSTLDRELK